MAPQSIKSQSVIPRLDGMARDRLMLQKLGALPDAEFSKEENLVRAQFYLRRALAWGGTVTTVPQAKP